MTPSKAKRVEFFFQNVSFLKSTTNSNNFPSNQIPEIAIVGRSNAGKSSVLNTLCKRKQLAHTSKTPGKTRLINFFSIIENQNEIGRIVDLPGYGYAKVDKSTKTFWDASLLKFLLERENLIGVVLVTDLRHALGKLDQKLISNMSSRLLYFHILFNKSDKLKKSDQTRNLNIAIKSSHIDMTDISYSIFSSTKRKGVKELFNILKFWLDKHSKPMT